jgi:hypothetical protein
LDSGNLTSNPFQDGVFIRFSMGGVRSV